MEKILIVKTSSLGDIIHTYPVLGYLRATFPFAKIDWVVEKQNSELVHAHPSIDHTLCVTTKEWRRGVNLKSIGTFRQELRKNYYDVVFDLQGNVKSGLILSQVRSTCKVGFGTKTVPELPNLLFTNRRNNPKPGANIRSDYLSLVKTFFGDNSPNESYSAALKISECQQIAIQNILQTPSLLKKLKVIVCPGSAWKNKQATPEALTVFLSRVQNFLDCSFLFLWGSAEERSLAGQLHERFVDCSQVIDRMSLPMVQNLMEGSGLVIAMDSLPLHLAGTTSTPSFSIFGPSSALKYKPSGGNHFAFQGECPYGRKFEKRCPILRTCPTGACIRNISGDELFNAFPRWWSMISD